MLHQQESEDQFSLELTHLTSQGTEEGAEHLLLHTNAGTIPARFHAGTSAHGAVVWVGGAGGGLDGPAGGLYPRLAGQLAGQHIASLRLDYRYPNELLACVMDTLMGVAYLQTRSLNRVVLVEHSFGGAVVICAGALGEEVAGVAALSSQTYGTTWLRTCRPSPCCSCTARPTRSFPAPVRWTSTGGLLNLKKSSCTPAAGTASTNAATALTRT